MEPDFVKTVARLLESPCWVIDLLPCQVPQEARGQFFAVEQYYLAGPGHVRLLEQMAHVLLHLNCYHDLTVDRGDGSWVHNPQPATLVNWLAGALQHGHMCALIDDGDALITASGGDTHLSLYNPSPELLQLLGKIVLAAGFHLWQSSND